MTPSRYLRPTTLPPLAVTARDRQLLVALDHFRVLTAKHGRDLVFSDASPRIVQERLRRLWAHEFIDRVFFSGVVDGTADAVRNLTQPVYVLAPKGERFLDPDNERTGKHERFRPSTDTLQHHLVAVDFLVAARVASSPDVSCSTTFPEASLRATVAAKGRSYGPFIVPDGAVTLSYPTNGRTLTFPIEIVRASVRGGNDALIDKLKRYVARNSQGWFKAVYGFETVRAVLIATPTEARARHYQALASKLDRGRGLLWFAHYERLPSAGPPLTRFSRSDILDLPWIDADGKTYSLHSPTTPHVCASSP